MRLTKALRRLWRDILASFTDFDHYLVQRFEWYTPRSVKRSVDRMMIINQVAQLVGGAVLVWLLYFASLPPLVVNVFTLLWLVVALVNVAQLAGEARRWWRGRRDRDDGWGKWRRGRDDGNPPLPPTPADYQRVLASSSVL